ncbi:RidA family protein, partial [Erwinia amylovora]|uniref:Rid family hydrolase n=1 Tax=Erwinia amylovora TaxID=552 RepID=UPI0020BE3450
VDNWIFVCNTAGRHPQSKFIPEDVREQTHQVFAYIGQALASVVASLADVVMSRVFLQDPRAVPSVLAIIGEMFRGVDPESTVTCP